MTITPDWRDRAPWSNLHLRTIARRQPCRQHADHGTVPRRPEGLTPTGSIPMSTANHCAPRLLVLVAAVSLSPSTYAADISGAWASDASVCSKVFVKNNNRVSFAPDAELYGGGFIVEGNQATGTFQKCKIKSMKNDGA